MENEFHISTFKNETSILPTKSKHKWSGVEEIFKQPLVTVNKKGNPAFSGAVYPNGSTRCKANVQAINLIVLDFDAGHPDDVCKVIQEKGWASVVVSSYSYTPEAPKFRVVLKPNRPILPTEWPGAFDCLCTIFPDMIDETGKDPSHIYYFPAKPSESAATYFKSIKGVEVDVDKLLTIRGNSRPLKAQSKGQTGQKSPSIREMADYAYTKVFSEKIWYFNQNFRVYDEGYWRKLTKAEVEVAIHQRLLLTFKAAHSGQIDDVVKTLAKLAARTPEGIEKNASLICVNNGVLNPLTGELQDHDPELYLTFKIPANSALEASAPRFMQYLEEVWAGEPDFDERMEFLQQWCGYLMTLTCKYEKFLWLEGPGGNGKSVLLEIMAALVGAENVLYAQLERLNISAVRAELEGKKLNISSEMSPNATIADGYLKQIVSGEMIEADRKYQESMSFRPYVKLVAATNALPRLLDRSNGFARRAVILTFNRRFSANEQDINLAKRIVEEELDGILAWSIEGLRKLEAQQRFTIPASSVARVSTYRTESCAVASFCEEMLADCQKGTEVNKLYEEFGHWCSTNGFKPCNSREFGNRLRALGIDKRQSNGKTYRLVTLKPASAEEGPCRREVDIDEEMREYETT